MVVERRFEAEENLGSLCGCLVEGAPEQRKRERTVRRRALLISVLLQAAVVAVLVLIPLFAQPAKIAQAYMPRPIYTVAGPKETHSRVEHPQTQSQRAVCRICAPIRIPPTIPTHNTEPLSDDAAPPSNGDEVSVLPGGIPFNRPTNVGPLIETHAEQPHVVHMTHIDPAMLIHRVEPLYPILAKQTGRSGRVELRAVIAADGTIQSLRVVSGDLLFYRSALDAVSQWRYRPTVLNGKPVEIDTFITVIYNVAR